MPKQRGKIECRLGVSYPTKEACERATGLPAGKCNGCRGWHPSKKKARQAGRRGRRLN